jgi:hypothetical protein
VLRGSERRWVFYVRFEGNISYQDGAVGVRIPTASGSKWHKLRGKKKYVARLKPGKTYRFVLYPRWNKKNELTRVNFHKAYKQKKDAPKFGWYFKLLGAYKFSLNGNDYFRVYPNQSPKSKLERKFMVPIKSLGVPLEKDHAYLIEGTMKNTVLIPTEYREVQRVPQNGKGRVYKPPVKPVPVIPVAKPERRRVRVAI